MRSLMEDENIRILYKRKKLIANKRQFYMIKNQTTDMQITRMHVGGFLYGESTIYRTR